MSDTPKNKVGRPSVYIPSMNKKAKEYLALCVDSIEEFHKTRGEKSDSYDRIVRVKLPTVAGLSLYLGVARSTIYKWAEEHKEFSDTLDEIITAQEDALISKGLSGEYNQTIVKLMLSSNHNYKEKSETDVTSGGEKINGIEYITPKINGEDKTGTDN